MNNPLRSEGEAFRFLLGTVVYFVARDVLGALTETWLLWYGLLFMAIIMFKPDGIAGIVRDLTVRWRDLTARWRPQS